MMSEWVSGEEVKGLRGVHVQRHMVCVHCSVVCYVVYCKCHSSNVFICSGLVECCNCVLFFLPLQVLTLLHFNPHHVTEILALPHWEVLILGLLTETHVSPTSPSPMATIPGQD